MEDHEITELEAPPPPPPPAQPLSPAVGGRSIFRSDGEERRLQRPRHGLPLYLFLTSSSPGEGAKVDPRCPNASNPYHVCTDYCLPKIAEAPRADGGKSPKSFFSFNSRYSSSSDGDSSSSLSEIKASVPQCPNASNPYHECSEHCNNKNGSEEATISGQSTPKYGKSKKKEKGSSEKGSSGRREVSSSHSWKVHPQCPNASNPYHICAQYCFDYLNEVNQVSNSVSASTPRKTKSALNVANRENVQPQCANSSNPYHKCTDYCFSKGANT